MEILTSSKRSALLEYLPTLRYTLSEWLFVELHINDLFDDSFTISEIAELLNSLFKTYNGRIYVCNTKEILMLIQWGRKNDPEQVVKEVKYHLPAGSCEIQVIPSSSKGLAKLELMIMPSKVTQGNKIYTARTKRRENVFIVADDDMFMRTTIKGIMSSVGSVAEAITGSETEKAYCSLNPDVVFLDIHLPEKNGHEVLQSILKMDPDAYVIMVSSDSSREDVQATLKKGAKDFLTKPFTRERILECLKQCPTIY